MSHQDAMKTAGRAACADRREAGMDDASGIITELELRSTAYEQSN